MARRFIYCVPLIEDRSDLPLIEDRSSIFIYCVPLMEDRGGS